MDAAEPLAGEDPECAAVVLSALAREGVTIRGGVTVARVRRVRSKVEVVLAGGSGVEETIEGSDLLIATGRQPQLESLNLAAAGVQLVTNERKLVVNRRMRTTNKAIYAIGDAIGPPFSAHAAAHHAELVIRDALHRQPAMLNNSLIPQVIYTDPELARVGLSETEARAQTRTIRVLRYPYRDTPRAQAERRLNGHSKVITDKNGRILGVTLVGAAAGELISTWTLALNRGLNVRDFAGIVAPYGTFAQITGRTAALAHRPRLTISRWRRILRKIGFG